MIKLTGITSDLDQRIFYNTEFGQIELNLRYSRITASWYLGIKIDDFELKERLLQTSENWLYQYSRVLGFGLKVEGVDYGIDLCRQNDFTENGFNLYLLNKQECLYVSNFIYRDNSELLEKYIYGQ